MLNKESVMSDLRKDYGVKPEAVCAATYHIQLTHLLENKVEIPGDKSEKHDFIQDLSAMLIRMRLQEMKGITSDDKAAALAKRDAEIIQGTEIGGIYNRNTIPNLAKEVISRTKQPSTKCAQASCSQLTARQAQVTH